MVKKEQAVETPEKVTTDKTQYWYGTGRRKTSIARVKLSLGKGEITVNDKPIEQYFSGASSKIAYESPLKAVGRLGDVSATVKVFGGGANSQLEAYVHGLSRALVEFDSSLRPTLSRAGLLKRDPRMKESLHFGLMGARKAKQSPKR
ncbi:MAG TPA: 30S ribosomal protein S9 [Patescibacteria group bacterium]|nr:30S ribosomal protein S9 [Patescibacteria group bacterium]